MSQLSFECNADLRLYDIKERQKVINRIEKNQVPVRLLKEIRDHYYAHLSKSHGVPDNYVGYHPDVIEAVKRKYPKLIEDIDNETFVRKKKHQMFSVVADKLYNGDINPMILKMYLEYLEPSGDDEEKDRNITIVLRKGEPAGGCYRARGEEMKDLCVRCEKYDEFLDMFEENYDVVEHRYFKRIEKVYRKQSRGLHAKETYKFVKDISECVFSIIRIEMLDNKKKNLND